MLIKYIRKPFKIVPSVMKKRKNLRHNFDEIENRTKGRICCKQVRKA